VSSYAVQMSPRPLLISALIASTTGPRRK
jgi:hypothetical protein